MRQYYTTMPLRNSDRAFQLKTRRDRLFGLWVATRLGYSGSTAESYARRIVMTDMQEAGEDEVLHQVAADLDRHANAVAEEALRDELRRFEELARDQLAREGWSGR